MRTIKPVIGQALAAAFLTIVFAHTANAKTSIQICQSLPAAMEDNIASWKNISIKGHSIIKQIDQLASNVNGILKIEADLKNMDRQLNDAIKLFDTFIPVVTPVSSVKNVFKLASDTFATIRTRGVLPAKDAATRIATLSGVRELQKQLDQNVKPKIQKTINIANTNVADVTQKLNTVRVACNKIADANCLLDRPLDQVSSLTNTALSLVIQATRLQNAYLGNESRVNDGLAKANSALSFSVSLSKQIGDIKKPISDIAGSVNKVGGLMDKKIRIKIATFDESFKLKDAFKKVGSIVNTIKKIPGVKDVEKQVNKPIEAVMNEVTKPITSALKPLEKGLNVPSANMDSFKIPLPDFTPEGPNGVSNLAGLDPVLEPLLKACK